MKRPLEPYAQLYDAVSSRLGPERLPLLIGIDGANGCGKSSTASWLAWQFGMKAIHLDLYTDYGMRALTFAGEVARLINRRVGQEKRPMIVEGILLLEALAKVDRKPDFSFSWMACPAAPRWRAASAALVEVSAARKSRFRCDRTQQGADVAVVAVNIR